MTRIDIALLERNIFNTRAKAQEAIKNGIIFCNGKCISKCSYNVDSNDELTIIGNKLRYVSRGGLKLEKAIKVFNIDLNNKIMCDIGSSTGGFSDCAIQNGIKKIYAIDVGSNQLDNSLRDNDKILLFENTDFRNIDINILKDVNIITIDISFISILKMLSKINELKNVEEIICLIKPQFECGKDIALKYKGVILNKEVHYNIISNIIDNFKNNFYVNGLTYSLIKGGSGNIEYLLYLNKANNSYKYDIKSIINNAFKETK